MPKSPEQLLQETHDMVTKVYTAIYGIEGTAERGMCGDFKDLKVDLEQQKEKQSKTELKLNRLIFFLIGAGILTGGGVGIAQFF
jgi:hypothetical protein